MIIQLIINILIMLALIGVLYYMQKKYLSFTKRVFTALALGIIFGTVLNIVYRGNPELLKQTGSWFNIVGRGYVKLLQMIVMPLIMVSIISAIINLDDGKKLGKMSGNVLAVLVGTAAIASIVGIFTSIVFKLNATGMIPGQNELVQGAKLDDRLASMQDMTIPDRLLDLLPQNPFADMAGARPTSTIAVVIFSAFLGIAFLGIRKKKPESMKVFKDIIEAFHDIIMRVVTLILRLTPYGILALMTVVVSTSNFQEIMKLAKFVLASYVAIAIMFVIHLIMLAVSGLNPIIYLKKVFPVLTFAFTSRTSAGAIPMNVETQTKKLGVPEALANLSASFGASIGQNGCAAIYPAMLAVMIAPTVGVNPLSLDFIVRLVVIITISSFGVAGVGGGATFAALIVLSSLNFPVALVGLLISVEPLIDMGRTALNVNDSILAGVISSKKMKEIDMDVYNDTTLIK